MSDRRFSPMSRPSRRRRGVLSLVLAVVASCAGACASRKAGEGATDGARPVSEPAPGAAEATGAAPVETREHSPAPSIESDPIGALEATSSEVSRLKERHEALKASYQTASPEERDDLRTRGRQLRERGEELLRDLASIYPVAFRANPGDTVVKEAMPKMVGLYYQMNRFAEVTRFGSILIANGKGDGGVAQVTGIAHFADHAFDKAENVLKMAESQGLIDDSGRLYAKHAHDYRGYWAREQYFRKEEAKVDDLPRVLFVTSRGEIRLELFENEAPLTVSNFIGLVERGFYDGTTFHRVIPAFMAQGGDPNSRDDDPTNDGQGDPGYTIPCECYKSNARFHFAGSVSMAHRGRDTGGSQFFITHLPTPHLNGKHTVFGRVLEVEDLELARALVAGDRIIEARVLRKRDHEYAAPPASPDPDGGPDDGE